MPPTYVAWRAGTTNRALVQASQAGNRFLGSLKGLQIRALATLAGGIHSLELITGPHKHLKIRAQDGCDFGMDNLTARLDLIHKSRSQPLIFISSTTRSHPQARSHQ